MFGYLSLGATAAGRLPLASPVLGGLALIGIVAVPSTVLSWFAARGDRRTAVMSLAVGVLIMGWILVEVAVIRELSFFHPIYLAVGAAMIVVGLRQRAAAGRSTR
jgi:hypothetical protein